MNKFTRAFSFAVLLAPLAAQAQWIVEDPAQVAQGVASLGHMIEQIAQAKAQLEQQKRMYESLSGASGFGRLLSNSAQTIQDNLPEDWTTVYNDAMGSSSMSGDATSMQEAFDSKINNMSRAEALAYANKQLREKGAYDRVMAQKAYNNQMRELEDIQTLTARIDTTTSQKEISDLQARIQTAQGTIQGEQAKLQLMAMLQKSQDKMLDQQKELAVRRYSIGTEDDDNTAPNITGQ
ncbi:type IV secretion system protein [Pseudomonas corrugata]|uniref:type IV secretion system protein n=1 Tax=Pseudomonas corrugata TaxID=47879 RepID=UPI0028C4474E|nr:type IV secretion system protein [Pseudomonas corrugata]MDU9036981.1 type IV secretion system protein [Pseudomonas corrugata]MDU9042791.1 type IV secretion system protein [Pseudomonas corrugata]